MSPGDGRDRLLELLADRAVQGLGPDEQHELDALRARFPGEDDEALDRAAAALHLAMAPPADEPLPAALRARIEAQAREHFRGGRAPAEAPRARTAPPARRLRWLATTGWLAAAASLAFAFLRGPVEEPGPAPAAQRAALLAEAPDAIRVPWTATGDPAGAEASGDVVWSNARQEGYLRFRGLVPNDPSESQYQLWIFDVAQDERYPIDGGVFDVPSEGEVVVPIRPGLAVERPTLFAVTVEKPGGVVVSSRERLPLLAKVDG